METLETLRREGQKQMIIMDEGASKSAAGDGIPTDISGGLNDFNPSLQDQTVPSLLNLLKQLCCGSKMLPIVSYFI